MLSVTTPTSYVVQRKTISQLITTRLDSFGMVLKIWKNDLHVFVEIISQVHPWLLKDTLSIQSTTDSITREHTWYSTKREPRGKWA